MPRTQCHADSAPPRSNVLGVRLSPAERVAVMRQADKFGVSVSEFVRHRALRGRVKVVTSPARASFATIYELKRITTNLHQIRVEFERREVAVPFVVGDTARMIGDFVMEQICADRGELATRNDHLRFEEPVRTATIKLRCSPAEHETIRKAAAEAGLSAAHYMRAQALAGAVTVVRPVSDFSPATMAALHDMGLALNAQAHQLNSGGDIPADLEQLCRLIHRTVSEELGHATNPGKGRP